MDRTRKTALNAIMQIAATLSQSLLMFFVTRAILVNIGSDYNGLTSTASQLLVMLSLIEGGFTLATLVNLYEPYNNKDNNLLSKFLSLSKVNFNKIGLIYLFVGIVLSFAYSPFIKTDANYFVVVAIMTLSVVPSAFSIGCVSNYRLLYQVSQTEYIYFLLQTVIYTFMYISEIAIVYATKNIIYARLCVALFQVLFGIIVIIDSKKRFPEINYKENHEDVKITGTTDVLASKLCYLIYTTAPVLFISTFVGTSFTSIYAVYNSVLVIIANVINSFLNAPRNAMGQIIHGQDKSILNDVFNEYENISNFLTGLLCSTTFALIIPFVRMYTSGITDVNYIDKKLAILLLANTVLQMVHIPSGNCIEVSGEFKIVKRIQSASAVIIVVFSAAGVYFYGLYGILIAKLITSLFLCFAEIYYVRKAVLKSGYGQFFKTFVINIVICAAFSVVEFLMLFDRGFTIISFIVYGLVTVLINLLILLFLNFCFNRNYLKKMFVRVKRLLKKS